MVVSELPGTGGCKSGGKGAKDSVRSRISYTVVWAVCMVVHS